MKRSLAQVGREAPTSRRRSGRTRSVRQAEARPTSCAPDLDLARDVDKAALCEDLRMILQASSRERAEGEKALLEKQWGKRYPNLVTYLEDHFDAVLAVLNVLAGHRKRLWTTNHVERVNQEFKRRGRMVRIWPNPASRDRLYVALSMEQQERWTGITWLKPEGA